MGGEPEPEPWPPAGEGVHGWTGPVGGEPETSRHVHHKASVLQPAECPEECDDNNL